MKKSYVLLLFIVLGFVAVGCSKTDSTSPARSSAELNAAAPEFMLRDLSGRNVSLSDYKGKVVLLEFWATWCPPCKASIPALVELNRKYQQKGFIVVGVSMDTDSDASEKIRQFSASHNVTFPVLLANETTPKLYKVISIPTSFLIGRDGNIVDIYKGYSEAFENHVSAKIEKLL
jgi:cytochrome c biogenesis protein CcmG, thiol:disulfide interchange protein DsbE